MVTYELFEETCQNDIVGNYVSYGIICYKDNNADLIIHDIFLDHSDAACFIDGLNKYKLDPIHLKQVIEEYLQYGNM